MKKSLFYIQVLKHKAKIEWLGENKYRLTWYYENGNKRWEQEYKDGKRDGKDIVWHENGNKWWETEYKDNKCYGKYIYWDRNRNKNESYYWKDKQVSRQEYLSLLKKQKSKKEKLKCISLLKTN